MSVGIGDLWVLIRAHMWKRTLGVVRGFCSIWWFFWRRFRVTSGSLVFGTYFWWSFAMEVENLAHICVNSGV